MGHFPQVFGQVNEWLILELHEIIRVPDVVAYTMELNLLCDRRQQGGLLMSKISPDLNQRIQYKVGEIAADNFAQFLRKVIYSYATCLLKNTKPTVRFSPSDIKYHPDINKATSLNNNTENSKIYIEFCAILKEAVSKIEIPKDFDKLDVAIDSKENRFSVN